MRKPHSGVVWLRGSPQAEDILRDLAHARLEATHAALDTMAPSKAIEHLRSLLVAYGVLARRDRRLSRFVRWSADKIEAIDDEGQRKIIEQFLRWHLLRNLNRHAEKGPIPEGPFRQSKQTLTVSIEFLAWLGGRGRTLAECTQQDIDGWFAEGASTKEHADRLLYWAIRQRIVRGVDLPVLRNNRKTSPMISQDQRLAIIRKMLLDDELALQDRVVGCLVILFGQVVSRITNLRLDDVSQGEGGTRIKLSKDWIEVPEPVATLLHEQLANRKHMNTAANPDSPWLFPGCVPGEPRTNARVVSVLRRHGLPVLASRNTTWQQLTRDVPPQVIADAVGISPRTAMQHAARAGADWAAYAARRSSS